MQRFTDQEAHDLARVRVGRYLGQSLATVDAMSYRDVCIVLEVMRADNMLKNYNTGGGSGSSEEL